MTERYPPPSNQDGPDDDCPYSWISEWLCEYVDGTMDPSMRAVFDEYLEANPELAEHVERLCRTRSLLNDCECQEQAVNRAKERLQRVPVQESVLAPEEAEESNADDDHAGVRLLVPPLVAPSADEPADEPPAVPVRASTVAAVASAMTLMLGVGIVAGAAFFSDPSTPPSEAVGTATATEQVQHAPDRPAVAPPTARRNDDAAPTPLLENTRDEETPAALNVTRTAPGDSMWDGLLRRGPALLQADLRR